MIYRKTKAQDKFRFGAYAIALNAFQEHGVSVSSGRFGAEMKVSLVNDGPVPIWLDTAQR